MDRSAKDQKILERVDKVDINGERALDEIYSYKEQIRHLGEERKRDIEETADFIKQLIDNNKEEWLKETNGFSKEIDSLKKEMIDRCTLKELLGLKQQMLTNLESKVELKEVQHVLNECQGDLTEQLAQYKQKIQDKLIAQEISLTRIIERKADHKDLKQLADDKPSKADIFGQFVQKTEFDHLKQMSESALRGVQEKLNKERKYLNL